MICCDAPSARCALALALLVGQLSAAVVQPEAVGHVRAQYEVFPYPPSEIRGTPLDHVAPVVLQSPSHLLEVNHYIFSGEQDWCSPIRVLVAGGGTGVKTLQLVRQLESMKAPSYEVVHLDLSNSSIASVCSGKECVRFCIWPDAFGAH